MGTFSVLKTKVFDLLEENESSPAYWSEVEIGRYINNALLEVASDVARYDKTRMTDQLKLDLSEVTGGGDPLNYTEEFEYMKIRLPVEYYGMVNVEYRSNATTSEPQIVIPLAMGGFQNAQVSASYYANTGARMVYTIAADIEQAEDGENQSEIWVYPKENVGWLYMLYYWRPREMSADTDRTMLPRSFDKPIVYIAAMEALIKDGNQMKIALLERQLEPSLAKALRGFKGVSHTPGMNTFGAGMVGYARGRTGRRA
jgi:hypothetical protein